MKPGTEIQVWNESNERNIVRLVEMPNEFQAATIRSFGLPEDINPAHVIGLGGKPYPTHGAILDLLGENKRNAKRIICSDVNVHRCVEMGCEKAMDDEVMFRVRCDIVLPGKDGDREFSAWGDACPHNCTSITRKAMARMAETRAINRAGRLAVLGGITTFEELDVAGGSEPKVTKPEIVRDEPKAAPKTAGKDTGNECPKCGATLEERSGVSKAGKPYRGIFCANRNCDHKVWLPVDVEANGGPSPKA